MAEDKKKRNNDNPEDNSNDVLELLTKMWAVRWQLFKWSMVGAVVGLGIAFSIPREYDTTVTLAPEMNDNKSMGGLGSLASMAGINLNSGDMVDAVYPTLYPDVVNSVPFMTGLFDVEVKLKKDGEEMTVQHYMEDVSSVPWWSYIMAIPGKIISLIKSSDDDEDNGEGVNPFRLTKEQYDLVEALRERISTNVDLQTSVVSINVKMQDPLVSAMLADTVVTRLQEYITDYRTNKARQDLEYTIKLNDEARQSYYEAQQRYADYLDRHQGIALHSAQTTRERLQNEAQLAFNLYNQTALKVQLAQAKVQENTPVYAVISPATIPVKASSPKKLMILIAFAMLGFGAYVGWMFFIKPSLDNYKKSKEGENTEESSIENPDPGKAE